MLEIVSSVGRKVKDDQKEYVFFHGTSYLGMSTNDQFHELIYEGMRSYGSNYPTSRMSNVRHQLYYVFESKIAEFLGFDQAISVSSGYLAGQLIAGIYDKFDEVYFSPVTHPALNPQLPNDILSFSEWTHRVTHQINCHNRCRSVAIVSNSLNSLMGEVYDFSFLLEINDKDNVYVIIDDSHGLGIIGEDGRGVVSFLPYKSNVHYIIVSSLAKAFGVLGGVVLCDNDTADLLRSSAIYAGGSAMSLAYIYAFLNASDIYKKQREKLLFNISLFNRLIENKHSLHHDNRFPVYYCGKTGFAEYCLEHGIIVSSFPYPFPESNSVTRIVVNSLHETEDLIKLSFVLDSFDKWEHLLQ